MLKIRFWLLFWISGMFLILSCNTDEGRTPILASVDNKDITEAQFESYLKFKRLETQDEKYREQLLEKYIERDALVLAIEKEPLLDKEFLAEELNDFRKEMVISRYIEKFLKANISDRVVKNFYDGHIDNYFQREAHAAHILVRTNTKMRRLERLAKLTAIREAYAQLKSGRDFKEIAQLYSEDRISAKKGGDLGWLKEGAIAPQFSNALFELKPGAISEITETSFGFHIIKLLEAPKKVKRPLEAVASDIRYQLRQAAKEAEIERLLKNVRINRSK